MPISPYYKPLYNDPDFERPIRSQDLSDPRLQGQDDTNIDDSVASIPSSPSVDNIAPTAMASAPTGEFPKKQSFYDYIHGYNQKSAQDALGNIDKLRVTPEDLKRSQDRQDLLFLQQGLSAATANIGNIGGKVQDDAFGKYLQSQVQGEKDALKQRQDAFTGAQGQIQQALKTQGEIGNQQLQEQINPLKLQQAQQDIQKGALDIQETQYKGDQLRKLRDPASEESARARQLAAQFSKGLGLDLHQMSGEEIMSKFPVIEKAFSSKEDRDFKAQQAREARAARMQELDLRVGEAKTTKTKNNQQIESDIRKEYNQLPIVKQFNDVDAGFRKIQESKSVPQGSSQRAPADIAMVFNFMKMLDPGSTVREGEYATAKNAAGVPDIVRNQFNKLKDGQFLTPDQREGFFNEAKSAYLQHVNQVKETQKMYSGIADKYGLDTKYLFNAPNESSIKPSNMQGSVNVASLPVWTPGGK